MVPVAPPTKCRPANPTRREMPAPERAGPSCFCWPPRRAARQIPNGGRLTPLHYHRLSRTCKEFGHESVSVQTPNVDIRGTDRSVRPRHRPWPAVSREHVGADSPRDSVATVPALPDRASASAASPNTARCERRLPRLGPKALTPGQAPTGPTPGWGDQTVSAPASRFREPGCRKSLDSSRQQHQPCHRHQAGLGQPRPGSTRAGPQRLPTRH